MRVRDCVPMRVDLLAFLGVSALVIATPGQDTALTIRNTLAGARRSGVATAAGVAGGQAIWTLAASIGLAAIVAASEPAYDAIRLVGAAYLVVLGGQTLLAALRGHATVDALPGRALPARVALRQGLLSNLANPKMAVFFTSLLPQFAESFAGLLVLGLVFSVLTFLWLAAYALAVARARDLLRRRRVRRALDAVLGTALAIFGVRLAADRA